MEVETTLIFIRLIRTSFAKAGKVTTVPSWRRNDLAESAWPYKSMMLIRPFWLLLCFPVLVLEEYLS